VLKVPLNPALSIHVFFVIFRVARVDQKTFVNVMGVHLLGPALSPGAVYVGSVLENSSEIVCIKGNVGDKANGCQSTTLPSAPPLRYDGGTLNFD